MQLKKRSLSSFLAITLCGIALTGCASSPNEDEKPPVSNSENSESSSSAQSGEQEETSETTSANNENSDSSEETDSNKEPKGPAHAKKEIKMEQQNIMLPTQFPDTQKQDITYKIEKNDAAQYTIVYSDKTGKELAVVSGFHYKDENAASEKIHEFGDGKDNQSGYPEGEKGEDLGHGISGYESAGAGSVSFSWKEGKWLFSILSLIEDQMDQKNIAQKMVDYLENHTLPAPDEKGVTSVHYSQGGEDVEVDIRFQKAEMIYQIKTTEVPLNALEMAVSME